MYYLIYSCNESLFVTFAYSRIVNVLNTIIWFYILTIWWQAITIRTHEKSLRTLKDCVHLIKCPSQTH